MGDVVHLHHDVIVFQTRPRSLQKPAAEYHPALETGCNKKFRTLEATARRKEEGGGCGGRGGCAEDMGGTARLLYNPLMVAGAVV